MEISMRTAFDFRDDFRKKAMELIGAENKSQAVSQVLDAFVREKRFQRPLDLRDKLHLEDIGEKFREMLGG
jgi:Arc/MetJ family transcription regulator